MPDFDSEIRIHVNTQLCLELYDNFLKDQQAQDNIRFTFTKENSRDNIAKKA